MKRLFILAVFMLMACRAINIAAENPDKYSYLEPRFIAGFGGGDIESTVFDSTFTFDLDNSDLGLSIDFLNPVADNVSLVASAYFLRSEIKNADFQIQKLNRFGFQFGFRFYFNPPSGLRLGGQ